jgi:3-deoxy-D-manno-octulosonic-acid transferase
MGLPLTFYRAVSPALLGLAPLVAPLVPKLQAGLRGREGLNARLLEAAPRLQRCLWIHAASVGEYLQGIPLVEAVRQEPAGQAPPIAFTHFSPSGCEFARKHPCADLHDYLPLDSARGMADLIAAWRPRAIVCVKFDVWPNLIAAASRAQVPVLLLAGSLSPRSARLRWPGRQLYRDVFDRFAHIGVCTAEDRRRFVDGLRVRAPVTVTGDTRVEQVIVRYERSRGGRVSERLAGLGGRLLVLGSTWPPDERLWLPVLPGLLQRHAGLRVVLCPHEPSARRLADLEAQLAASGLASCRLSALLEDTDERDDRLPRRDQGDADVILVDSVGVLAEIYRAGHLAYVGGSFTTGVHNTMEPAVARLPVLFGPRIQNAEEAGVLVRREAGFVTARPAAALACASRLLADPGLLARTGEIARQIVLEQRGATARSLAVLRRFL